MKNDHRELERTEATAQEVEPTRERPRIAPLADVYETDANFVLVADMPGVDETSVEVTLQNRVLQITGQVKPRQHEGYRRVYAEFDDADYERAFQISADVDASAIQATVKNGVLRVSVPKRKPAQKKVPVLAG
jgi:HSP20 family protein